MGFTTYWVLLLVSGILMLVMAGTGFGQRTAGQRAVNALFGLGFLGYGLYLGFIFKGGHYFIFFYAFILPILMIVNAVKNAGAKQPAQ